MFSTFSTEFSTSGGGKHYTSRNGCRRILEISGLKCGHSAFYKKESRRFFFCFYSLLRLTGLLFSNLESYPGQFSTNRPGEKPGVENGHKRWFSTLFLHPQARQGNYPFRHRLRRCHLPQGDGFWWWRQSFRLKRKACGRARGSLQEGAVKTDRF